MRVESEALDVSEMSCEDILQMATDQQEVVEDWLSPNGCWLTESVAHEYLKRGVLSLSEVMALLSGLHPQTSKRGRSSSFIDPKGQDVPAAERMLDDIDSGRVGCPMTSREFVTWCLDWQGLLPDALAPALVEGSTQHDQQRRKNSADLSLAEVVRLMAQARDLLVATNQNREDGKLPGSKAPYCDYLRAHSMRLRNLGDNRLAEYLKQAGCYWSQSGGGREEINAQIRRALGLSILDSQESYQKLLPATGKLSTSEESWLTRVPRKS